MASAPEILQPRIEPQAPAGPTRAEKTATGTIQNLLAHGLLVPTGFVIAAFVSRTLGPSEYGNLVVAISIVTWLEMLIQTIFSSAIVTFVAESRDWESPARVGAQFQTGSALAVGAALFLAAPAVAALLGAPELGSDLRLFAIDIPLISLSYVYGSVLIGRELFGRNSLPIATFWLGRMLFMVLLVALTHSVAGAILGTVCAAAVRLAVSCLLVRVPLWGRGTFPVRRLLSYTSVSVFFAITIPLFDKIGLFLTKALDPNPQTAGYYGAALNLITVPALLAGTVAPLILASLTKELASSGLEAGRQLVRQGNRMILFLLPFTGVAVACSTGIVTLIYGSSFAPTGMFFTLLAFAAALWASISLSTGLLVAAGRLRWLLLLHVPLLPLLIVSGQVAISRMGGIGGAWATLAVGAAGAAAAMLMVWRYYGTCFRPRTFFNVLLATLLPLALGSLWNAMGWLVILKFGGLAAADFGLLVLLREFNAGDLWFVRTLASRFLSNTKGSDQSCN
ncbi:MAG TPA: lipopolysaccharide biosynthesis protein [Chloroflexota bacterium]|nr:lipopolysaccharide biosynthesis protein [Chloroflexota bacterium]